MNAQNHNVETVTGGPCSKKCICRSTLSPRPVYAKAAASTHLLPRLWSLDVARLYFPSRATHAGILAAIVTDPQYYWICCVATQADKTSWWAPRMQWTFALNCSNSKDWPTLKDLKKSERGTPHVLCKTPVHILEKTVQLANFRSY